MISLLKHNLVAGWRNVMKYKVQNTVSVLCLAVGAILFAISLYFANRMWENDIKYYFNNVLVKFSVDRWYDDTQCYSWYPYLSSQEINKLYNLPSVKSVCFYAEVRDCTIQNFSGSNWIFGLIVSLDWLKENNFRSAVTGKKIGILKPGTIVASKQQLGENMIKIGNKIEYNFDDIIKGSGKVTDVVYSTTLDIGQLDVIVVAPCSEKELFSKEGNGYGFYTWHSVRLNEGYTQEQFKKDFKKAFPKDKIHLYSEVNWQKLLSFLLLILFGATLLIISISGYLKMQLQLFCLRSREMAMRRCNGAKPSQLFILLCTELLIVFLFVAIVAILLSVVFYNYSIPLLFLQLEAISNIYIDSPTIYRTEGWIIFITFVAAVGIAWIVVHKMLNHPLSTVLGRPFTQRTVWNKTMQITQYSTEAFLLTAILFLIYVMSVRQRNFNLPADAHYYKTVYISEYNEDEMKKLCADKYECAWMYNGDVYFRDTKAVYEGLWQGPSCTVSNVEAYEILKIEVKENYDTINGYFRPVLTKVENAPDIIKQLGLKYKPSNKVYISEDSAKYIKLGWAKNIPCWTEHNQIYGDGIQIIEKTPDNVDDPMTRTIMFIKPSDKDVNKFQQIYPTASTLFDEWLIPVKEFDFYRMLLSILAVVSILSIVLTVYSSVSLETRGKQKEVAIRKVNGAKTSDIVKQFSKYYLVMMGIAFGIIAIILCIAFAVDHYTSEYPAIPNQYIIGAFIIPYFGSVLIITLTTILTLWQKIYKISHINPALLIKKE